MHPRKIRNITMFTHQQVEHYTAFITMELTKQTPPEYAEALDATKVSRARPKPWEEVVILLISGVLTSLSLFPFIRTAIRIGALSEPQFILFSARQALTTKLWASGHVEKKKRLKAQRARCTEIVEHCH
jgi:hypothetical protein